MIGLADPVSKQMWARSFGSLAAETQQIIGDSKLSVSGEMALVLELNTRIDELEDA